ncbi:MAG: hypothetical protein K6G75_08860 [Lachnospiraceae bacterium]|nr:hypothetical protein [Lachnospiraceae bacterium]
MITITTILICAVLPFILVFVLMRLIIHFVEKTLDFLIEKIFSLPEILLDSIKEKFKKKEIVEAIESKD